jgi:hypothetical protein
MATDTELAVPGPMEVLREGGIVEPVAGPAVDGLAIPRIPRFLPHRMGDTVLMGVARVAELDGVVGQQKGLLPTVRVVADVAGQTVTVGEVATFLSRLCPAGIVAREADTGHRSSQEALAVAGVRVVTVGAIATTGRHVGETGVA